MLLDLTNTNDELHMLEVSRAGVEKWLYGWEITPSEKGAFLERLVDDFSKVGPRYILSFPFTC